MHLSKDAKKNLENLDRYHKTEWFTEQKKLMTGDSFGHEEMP